MITEIYSLKDVCTKAFMKPMFLQNRAVLERALLDAKNDENSTIAMHPEDYQVYRLGSYDDQTGEIKAEPPTFLLNIADLKERE